MCRAMHRIPYEVCAGRVCTGAIDVSRRDTPYLRNAAGLVITSHHEEIANSNNTSEMAGYPLREHCRSEVILCVWYHI